MRKRDARGGRAPPRLGVVAAAHRAVCQDGRVGRGVGWGSFAFAARFTPGLAGATLAASSSLEVFEPRSAPPRPELLPRSKLLQPRSHASNQRRG